MQGVSPWASLPNYIYDMASMSTLTPYIAMVKVKRKIKTKMYQDPTNPAVTYRAVENLIDPTAYDEIEVIPFDLNPQNLYVNCQVVDNQRISVTQRQSALDAKALAENGAEAAEIKKILEDTRFDSHIYIMVDTLKYLKKGGRITPAAAMIAGVLNIKPILQIQGEKLDTFSKCRGIKQAKKIMLDAVAEGIEKEFGGIATSTPGAWVGLAHTQNFEAAEEFEKEAEERFPGFQVHVDQLPISIACHIGKGSLALTCTKVLPGGVQYPS